jgi:ribonuclease T2
LTYFRTALSLRLKYNPYTALANAGIVPGNKYDTDAFQKALQDAFGVEVSIKCRRGQIQEVWMWMKVRGSDNYMPVPPVGASNSGACGRIIYYPTKGSGLQ